MNTTTAVRGASVALLALLLSCLAGPPEVAPRATLAPTEEAGGASATAPFAVVFAGPHGVTSLTEPAVTVLFNRAMRDPDAADEGASANGAAQGPDAASGVPAIRLATAEGQPFPGTWRFLGTHGVLFIPDKPLPGSTKFQVSVPAGTRSKDGEVLRADYPFEFQTPRPLVIDSEPKDGADDLRPGSVVTLRWNEPMDPAEVQRAAHLYAHAKPGAPPRPIAFSAAHPQKGKYLSESLVLTPSEKLPEDSAIELVLDKGLHGEGPIGTTASRTLSFRTYGAERLVDVRCPRATGPRCQAHRDFTIVLSNAVAPAEFRAHLVAPDLPRTKPTAGEAKRAQPKPLRELLVGADPEIGARYHMRLTRGMRDVFGQTLDKDLVFDVDIEAPFTIAGRAVGADAAAPAAAESNQEDGEQQDQRPAPGAPDETRPRRARLDYDVKIGLVGHTVEALAKQGIKSHKIPIGAVNVPTYGLYASALTEDDAITWLGHHPKRHAARPVDLRWSWILPGAAENVRSVRSVDLDQLLSGSAGRGAALIATAMPGSVSSPTTDLVTVTDLAVTAKVSRYGTAVWVTRLSSGAPVQGATVSVLEPDKGERAKMTTDGEGLAVIESTTWSGIKDGRVDPGALFVVRAGDDWTWQKVERASASYRKGVAIDLAQRGSWAGIVYTDRGVYRPGETMKLASLFRKVDAKGIAIAPGEEVRIAVKDAQDETVFDGRAKLDVFGEVVLDVPIPKTAHLGEAHVEAELGRKNGDTFSTTVQLAAYKASEFKVSVDPDQHDYVRGDVARFDVTAEYLFGAPMKDAGLSDHVSRTSTSFVPPHSDAFVTTDEANILDWPETNPKAAELRDKDDKTDEEGRHSLSVPLDLPRMRGPENVTLETEVTDLTHQTVARRATVRVHPAAFYLGIERLAKRFVAVGADVRAEVATIDRLGAHVPGAKAKVDLVRRTWTGVVLDEGSETPRRRSHVKDDVVGTCEVTTNASVAACPLHVAEPGLYLLRARAKDDRGNAVGASLSFYAVDDRADTKTSTVAWADPDSQTIKLEPDKKKYDAGDVAKILVRNPFKEADAWITVERAGVLSSRVVTLKGPMPVVEVPISEDYFPNVFVGVHLVRGRVSAPPESGADVGAPAFRMGVVNLDVNPETHRLKAAVSTNKKEYRPGEDVDADVLVSGRDGRAARAAVTFYAVDEGVLMLTSYETPDPLPAFATQRRLSVFDVESRESLAHVLPLKNGERVRPLGWEYLVTRAEGDKGGEGGGGGEGMRADFKTTAFFDAEQVTSNEGRAHYRFKLPDNLTTFRLMAVVAGADDRFGSGEATITTSRKLMARPALPRIVRAGDTFEAGVIVTSRDLPETSAEASIQVKGLELAGPASRKVVVPKGGNVEVRFPVRATAAGDASIELAVAGGGEKDSILAKRTVVLPVSQEVASSYGDTTDAAAVSLGDLSHMRTDEGGLEVHVAGTALVGLGTSVDRAIDYPYGCTEQLTSRILPLLVLPEMARQYGARMPAKIDDKVDEAIGELLTHQTGSGGFGFWGDDDAVPWLSAYAMLAVEGAAKKGHFVPKSARDEGIEYLRHELDRSTFGDDASDESEPETPEEPDDDAQSHGPATPEQKKTRAYATVAFIADVLAQLGQPDAGYLNRLYDARKGRPLFAEALLLHAMVLAHMPRAEVTALAQEISSRVRVGANEAFADELDGTILADLLDSSARTTALVLRALVAVDPAFPCADPAAADAQLGRPPSSSASSPTDAQTCRPLTTLLTRGLLSHRTNGAWRSTQENVWALLALDDYRRLAEASTPDFDARVFLGGARIGELPFHGRAASDEKLFVGAPRVARSQGEALTFQVVGQGRLFYSAELRYDSAELPARSADRGLFVQKLVRSVTPEELAKATESIPKTTVPRSPAGHLVLVDLLFESAEPREQVVISDPLPAGLEPIDYALDTTARTRPVEDEVSHPDDPKRNKALFDYGAFKAVDGMHREQKDDQVLTFLPHVEPGIYHFRYVARATVPGDFVVPPTRAECMYSPEVWGRTAATRFTVTGAGPVVKKAAGKVARR